MCKGIDFDNLRKNRAFKKFSKMEKEKDYKGKKHSNIKEEEDDVPRIKGHYRRISRTRRIRISPHRRRLPTKRWRIFR